MKKAIVFQDCVKHFRALNESGRMIAWRKDDSIYERLKQLDYVPDTSPEMVAILQKRFRTATPHQRVLKLSGNKIIINFQVE